MTRLRKCFNHAFLLAGSTLLIVMTLIVALNFSKDASLFSERLALPSPSKSVATQLPTDVIEDEDYGTLKYERKNFNSGGGSSNGDNNSKKLKGIKVEIIDCSGKEKSAEGLKAALGKLGVNAVVSKKEDKSSEANEQTDGEPASDNTTGGGNESTPSIHTPLTYTPGPSSDAASLHTPRRASGSTPESTFIHTPIHTPVYTPVPVQPSELPAGEPQNGDNVKGGDADNGQDKNTNDDEENMNGNIVDKTLIIERNDKQLGTELKKVVKVGEIKKEIDPKYGFDVTIILGKDYMP